MGESNPFARPTCIPIVLVDDVGQNVDFETETEVEAGGYVALQNARKLHLSEVVEALVQLPPPQVSNKDLGGGDAA